MNDNTAGKPEEFVPINCLLPFAPPETGVGVLGHVLEILQRAGFCIYATTDSRGIVLVATPASPGDEPPQN